MKTSVYDTDEGKALLAAILADPAADLPRLVFADLLDEHGEAERAEFIRLQCELGVIDDHRLDAKKKGGAVCLCDTCRNREALRERERHLWGRSGVGLWFPEVYAAGIAVVTVPQHQETSVGNSGRPHAVVRGGFVDEVRGPFQFLRGDFRNGYADGALRAILKTQPVSKAIPADKVAQFTRDGYCWFNAARPSYFGMAQARAELPPDLFARLAKSLPPAHDGGSRQAFPSGQDAIFALSRVLIAEAKGEPF